MSHGGHVIVENPVHRGAGSQFAIPGREQHSSLWQYPPMVAFSQKHDMRVTVFDQCRCGADSMKTTQLLSSPSVHEHVHRRLAPLMCNHTHGEHAKLLGSKSKGGEFRTKAAEQFPSALNQALAESMLQMKNISSGWLNAVGSVIGSYSNRLVMAVSSLIAAESFPEKPPDDPLEFVRAIHCEPSLVTPWRTI